MTIETVRRVMTRRVMMVLLVLVVGGLGVYGAFMLAEIAFSVSKAAELAAPPFASASFARISHRLDDEPRR